MFRKLSNIALSIALLGMVTGLAGHPGLLWESSSLQAAGRDVESSATLETAEAPPPEPIPPLTFAVSLTDDDLMPLPGATVIVSQEGVDTLTTDSEGFAELPAGAVERGELEVLIEHAGALRQYISLKVPFRFDYYTLYYSVPMWRAGAVALDGDSVRTSNELNALVTEAVIMPGTFSFDYANLRSHDMVQRYVEGTVPDSAHTALVIRSDADIFVDSLEIYVDTEDLYGTGVSAAVQAVDILGDPFPGISVTPHPGLTGYPTAFSVSGMLPMDQPVIFLLLGEPAGFSLLPDEEMDLGVRDGIVPGGAFSAPGGDLILAEPCENLPADETNPDPDICQHFHTFLPQAQLIGCIANCGGDSNRKGKFGGKVTGQVGVKVGLEAQGGGGGASIGISASGEISGWFEEEYDIPAGKQRCWYLCSRKATFFCCDWLCDWFGLPQKVEHVYAVGTDVVDQDCN